MKQLNTMDTFLNGFKIERNGVVITLTPEEMSDFRYLEKATTGRDYLKCYNCVDEEEKAIIDRMKKDEEICYNIEDDILDIVYQDRVVIVQDIIDDYIKKNRE